MIRSSTVRGEISIDNVLVMEKLEGLRVDMKTVNAYYRDYRTLEGCSGLTFEVIGKLQASMCPAIGKSPCLLQFYYQRLRPKIPKVPRPNLCPAAAL